MSVANIVGTYQYTGRLGSNATCVTRLVLNARSGVGWPGRSGPANRLAGADIRRGSDGTAWYSQKSLLTCAYRGASGRIRICGLPERGGRQAAYARACGFVLSIACAGLQVLPCCDSRGSWSCRASRAARPVRHRRGPARHAGGPGASSTATISRRHHVAEVNLHTAGISSKPSPQFLPKSAWFFAFFLGREKTLRSSLDRTRLGWWQGIGWWSPSGYRRCEIGGWTVNTDLSTGRRTHNATTNSASLAMKSLAAASSQASEWIAHSISISWKASAISWASCRCVASWSVMSRPSI